MYTCKNVHVRIHISIACTCVCVYCSIILHRSSTLTLEHSRREVGINNYNIMCLSCTIQYAIIFKVNVTNVCMCIW